VTRSLFSPNPSTAVSDSLTHSNVKSLASNHSGWTMSNTPVLMMTKDAHSAFTYFNVLNRRPPLVALVLSSPLGHLGLAKHSSVPTKMV
jgi:hypothetical protein